MKSYTSFAQKHQYPNYCNNHVNHLSGSRLRHPTSRMWHPTHEKADSWINKETEMLYERQWHHWPHPKFWTIPGAVTGKIFVNMTTTFRFLRRLLWESDVSPRTWVIVKIIRNTYSLIALQWHHNEHDDVSNHQPHRCLLKRLFKAQIKENIKAPRHWPLWGEFTSGRWIPTQRASNAENVPIWWRHHGERRLTAKSHETSKSRDIS